MVRPALLPDLRAHLVRFTHVMVPEEVHNIMAMCIKQSYITRSHAPELDVQASLQHGKPGDAEGEMLALAGSDAEADLVLEGIATMAAQPGVSGSSPVPKHYDREGVCAGRGGGECMGASSLSMSDWWILNSNFRHSTAELWAG